MNASPLDPGLRVRVYLPTYRRPKLLPRALASLLAQTHANWICELHNDDPRDRSPEELVRGLADPRIELHTHERNLGPVASFNLFYQSNAEPFFAILEDDNGWEPMFLEKMLSALQSFPDATLAWCNQRIWRETQNGACVDTGALANPVEQTDPSPRLIPWPQLRQIVGGIHANGAMIMRSRAGQNYTTPAIPFSVVEAWRERMIPHPMVYVPQPLAIFTQTVQTARDHGSAEWGAIQVALAAAFFRHGSTGMQQLTEIWNYFKAQTPPMTNELIAAALLCREARPLLRLAGATDWFRFCCNAGRHPLNFLVRLRLRRTHADWWNCIEKMTAERFAEARTGRSGLKPIL